ncbi:MAG: S49 family peptidase [Gammaproteobacteria bacterium]|nr:MAG: S49 family peptidase [Gammaproteobacteria bacterium]
MSEIKIPPGANWERSTIEKIALAGIVEQRKHRRWRIFFGFLFFAYLTFIIGSLIYKADIQPKYDVLGNKVQTTSRDHIALVRLNGVIASDKEASAENLSALIRKAAAKKHVKGLLIEANSPGGSPVQSSLVFQTIREVKKQFNKPIKTVVTDVCASGCYYIVAASDEIYADKSSIVGSIGVISQSYGYQEAAKKLGIEPRTYTAGKNKDFLNAARQPTAEEIAFLKKLLDNLHQHFIDAVKTGRGERLSNDPDLFTGLFWTGSEAKTLGLIDGIATPQAVAKKIGNYPVYDYSAKSPLEKALQRFGAEAENVVGNAARAGIDHALAPDASLQFK